MASDVNPKKNLFGGRRNILENTLRTSLLLPPPQTWTGGLEFMLAVSGTIEETNFHGFGE